MNKMSRIDVDTGEALAKPRARTKRIVLMALVPLLVLAVGAYFWLTSGRSVDTDNAYVKQDIVAISAQVSGPVIEVFVTEGQRVKRGDPLYRVDPSQAEVALMQAEAQLAAAELQTRQLTVQAAGGSADIRGAEGSLVVARRSLERQSALLKDGFTTRARYDEAYEDVVKAEAALADARTRAANASAAVAPAGSQPQVAAARAAIAKARLDLRNGLVRAPFDGVVAKSQRLLPGQTVIPGVAMLSLVRDRQAWVEANFKEGDLARMAVGQPATIRFDAYPDLTLHGHVETIGAGTGSEFAVLPAQNANGNWVKVTQRVPVRIAFDEKPPRQMIAGLSAKVEVDLSTER